MMRLKDSNDLEMEHHHLNGPQASFLVEPAKLSLAAFSIASHLGFPAILGPYQRKQQSPQSSTFIHSIRPTHRAATFAVESASTDRFDANKPSGLRIYRHDCGLSL
jgi:hypothetical protein